MKKYIFILVINVLFFACNNDSDEDIFGKDPNVRVAEKIVEYNNILTSKEDGWKLVYFPNQNMGGYTHLIKFAEGNKVVMANETSEGKKDTSLYNLHSSESILLAFELNTLITEYSEPNESRPNGIGGDFEFYVESVSDNEVILKGRKMGAKAVLVPATKDEWDTFFTDCSTMEKHLDEIKPDNLEIDQWFINKIKNNKSLNIDIAFDKANRNIEIGYLKDNTPVREVINISFFKGGFKLAKEININGIAIQNFIFDETEKLFKLENNDDVTIRSYVNAYPVYNYGKEISLLGSLTDNKESENSSSSIQTAKAALKTIIGGDIEVGIQIYNSTDTTKFSFMCLNPEEWWVDPVWHDIYTNGIIVNEDNSVSFIRYTDAEKEHKNKEIAKNLTEANPELLNKLFNSEGWFVYKGKKLSTWSGTQQGYLFISKNDSNDWFYMFSDNKNY